VKQQAEQQAAYRQQFQQYAQSQDAAFAQKHPEFQTEEGAAKFREKALMPLLKEVGLSPQRVAELWGSNDLFRSSEAQRILYFAAKGFSSEQAARAAVPKTIPKPQSSNAVNGAPRDDVFAAANSGDMASFFRLRAQGRS
jgi:hypothetical protein